MEKEQALKGNEVKVEHVKQQLKSGDIIKKDLPKFSAGGTLTTEVRDLSRLFYDPPTGRPDGIFQPLLYGVARLLQEKGVPSEDLRSGLLIFTTINSSRLGYPLSLQIVPNNELSAIGLLDHCVSLAPVNSSIEFQKVKPEHLFLNSGYHYQNKCIICPEPNGLSKVDQDINLLLTRGHAIRQEVINKKYDIIYIAY